MKKITIYSSALAMFALSVCPSLVSCSQEDLVAEAPGEKDVASVSPFKIPLREAIGNAERAMRLIEGGRSTRSRTLGKVEYISSAATRSGSPDTLFYVVNFSGDNGFAVLSADRRLPDVYAISDEGHLDMNDTVHNKGLGLFFSGLPASVPPIGIDTTVYEPLYPPSYEKDNSYRIDPMFDGNVRRWHQGSPFNLMCPIKYVMTEQFEVWKEERSDVGCVPLSTAMIMSYYEWPKVYNRVEFNWSVIKTINPTMDATSADQVNGVQKRLLDLLAWLGDQDNYASMQSPYATERLVEPKYKDVFQKYGYRRPADFEDFSNSGLKAMIDQRKPVLIYGNGHMWVVDGLIYDADVEVVNPGGMNYWKRGEGLMFHLVWGWGGEANGYFRFDDGFEHIGKFQDSNDPEWQEYWMYHREISKYRQLRICNDFEPLR